MRFFSVVLLLLLVFDGLKGLTLPQERPDKGLNTTLLANFSGLYVRRNPCSNEQMESSSYEASHEFHHHTKGSNWTEYTNKCSLLISNFLKSISNLIKFNNKHDGTFTFHVNTSISQKQADQYNCKGQRYSLPTIVIEATNCANPEESKKPGDKGLTQEGPKKEVVTGLFGKQKRRRDPEKAFGELSAVAQGSAAFSGAIREETGANLSVTEISEEPLTIFETTQITETEMPCTTPVNSEDTMMSQTDSIDDLILSSTEKPNLGVGNRFRNSKFEVKPTGSYETPKNRGLSSPDSQQHSFNGVRKEASPISSISQQPKNRLYNRASQLPQFFLTTVSPITRSKKIETIEEITEYDSEQPEGFNAGNLQKASFNSNSNPNVKPVQSAESLDYLEKETEFNIPNVPNSATGLPEYLPTTVQFEQEKLTTESPPGIRQPQIIKQSDILPSTSLTSEISSGISSIGLGLQTAPDAAQLQPKNLFEQRLESPESLVKSNQKAQLGISTQGSLLPSVAQYEEEIINQFQSSEQSDQTYLQNSETVADNSQNFSEDPVYANTEISPPREVSQPETVLNEGSVQPLNYVPTTWKPVPTNYDEKTTENLNFKPGRQVAKHIANLNEQPKSFNRPPVTEPTTDTIPVTYSPQGKGVSSLEKEIVTTESSLRKVSQIKPNIFLSQTLNYGSPTPPQGNLFVPESSTASDVTYDYSDPLSSASSTTLPEPTVSESDSQMISQEPVTDYNDFPLEQSPDDVTDPGSPLNDFLQDSPTTPYSGSKSETTTTVYESDNHPYSQHNQQLVAPTTGIYEPQTTPAPRPAELNIPMGEFQSNTKRLLPSENYTPKTAFPNYGTINKKNFNLLSTNYPTTVPPEFQSETVLGNENLEPTKFSATQLPVGSFSSTFSEGLVKTTEEINSSAESESFSLKPLDYQTPSSLPKFQQSLGTSTNIPDRNQFPVIVQPQSRKSEDFSETTIGSSDVYSQQTSSVIVPVSDSQEGAANIPYDDQRNSLQTVNSESENVSASEESYYLNQNDADTSEQRQYDDTISSQDARTQIPQPQPSLDYPDQLLNSERESNIASTDLKTSKTFEGSEPNFQPLLTYSPSPSIPSKTQTFTTEAYESDGVADEYPLPSQLQPEEIESTALETAETSSSSFSQLSSVQNIATVDTTELPEEYSTPMYNRQFIPVTPSPSLTAAEEPPFVKTDLPAFETYSAPEAFVQDIPTTPRPQSINSVKHDQEIITTDSQPTPSPSPAVLLHVNYPDQFLHKKEEQGFVGGNLAVTQQLEDRLERSDIKATTSELVVKNSNRGLRDERVIQKSNSNQDIIASSTALVEKKYDASSQQLPGQSVTLPLLNKGINNSPKTGAYPNGLAPSAVGPVHTKTTFDEEVITTDNPNSLSLPSTQAPPVGYSQRPDEHFERQRQNFLSSTTPQPSRQFYSENRPTYYPPQGFTSQHQFENRPYGNYPQPMDFNPQPPRPRLGQFDNFARDQRNQFPTSFQNNQFESRFPVSSRFQPGLDPQKDGFMFPGQPSNFGNRYFPPNGRPNFPYTPSSRSGMNPESQVPPNFFSSQRPNSFEERDSQYQSYQGENFKTQLTAPPYAQNYGSYPYYPRDDFNERFGPNYPSFGPESREGFHPEDQIPYNQMMPPYRGHQAGYFNSHGPPFLNNSNQQIDERYQQHTFDHRVETVKGEKIQETEKIDMNQASPEVLADYKKALTELPSGEKLVKFDEEVITISPEKETSSEATVVTEKHEQRQDATSYSFQNQNSGQTLNPRPMGVPSQQAQGNLVFRGPNRPLDFPLSSSSSSQSRPLPFSQSVDSFGQQQPSSLPNFSNQFRSASSDFQQQSNANFVNPQKSYGGNEVGPNPSQSDSYALGPDQISPSRKPDPASSRRSNVPSPYRNPVARPIAGPETFSSG